MAQKLVDQATGTAQTTSATAVTAITFVMPDNCGVRFRVTAVGRRASDGAVATMGTIGSYKRHSGTTTAVTGSPTADGTHRDDTGWVGPSFALSGNNVLIQVAGEASATIEWFVVAAITLYQP